MRSKTKQLMFGILAAGLSGLTASACLLDIRIACPNDLAAVGVEVCVEGVGCNPTDDLGIATIGVPDLGTYTVCVNLATLPPGAKLQGPACRTVKVESDAPPVINFVIDGDFCSAPPPPGECWLTGGGTIGKIKGVANYSFGGVVYPGCSSKAADGGNWNVIDHFAGLHFQGQHIIVDSCEGVPTKSPKVTVNIIDFHGEGVITGIGDNPLEDTAVTFVGRAVDRKDGGADNDLLFLIVSDANGVLMQIGASAADPVVITTGNLQIHQSSCAN
jgi:hypothetical protein